MSLLKYLDLSEKVNPCWLVRQPGGEFVLKHRLKLAGYSAKQDVLDATVEALYTNEILLLEGRPGAGKTMLYEAMVKAFELPRYQVNCNVETSHSDIIGKFLDTLQNQFVIQSSSAAIKSFDDLSVEQWTLRFFKVAQPLLAYVNAPLGTSLDPCLLPNSLLLDEIDKLAETVQDSALQLFNDRQATIDGLLPSPFVGMPDGALPPFVVFTSNNMRGGVSGPLRDRAGVFLYIETPTPQEEYVILKTKFPTLSEKLLRQTLKLIRAVRNDDLIKQKPQIRAASKFVNSILLWGIEDLSEGDGNPLFNTERNIRKRIGGLVKYATDFINAQASITAYAAFVTRQDSFDEIIEQGAELYRQGEAEHQRQVTEFMTASGELLPEYCDCENKPDSTVYFVGDQPFCPYCNLSSRGNSPA